MPDTKSAGDSPEPTGSTGAKKKNIITAVLAVVLVGVGFVLGGKLGGSAPAAAEGSGAESEAEEEPTSEEPHVGVVVDLDAVNVNLADGHYLRVAISLGLTEDAVAAAGHGDGGAELPLAAASDVVLRTFSGRTMADLSTAEGREASRAELIAGLISYYGDGVVSVYYTEFVMQ